MKQYGIGFVHKGKSFSVDVERDEANMRVVVQVRYKNKPLGPKYSVSFDTAADYQAFHGRNAVDELIAIAKRDVTSGHFSVPE